MHNRSENGCVVVRIEPDPAMARPVYRCEGVFNTDFKASELPLAHLERFIGFLEQAPRQFFAVCQAVLRDEGEIYEQDIAVHEVKMAELPAILALKRPEILEFQNTAITQPRFREDPASGVLEEGVSLWLPALEYATAAVADCYDAEIPLSASLLVRLQVALAG